MDQQTLVYFVWAIPLLPLLAFFAIMLFARGRDRLSHTIAIGAMVISLVLAQIVFWNAVAQGGAHEVAQPAAAEGEHAAAEGEHGSAAFIHDSHDWLPQGAPENALKMGVLVDPLTAAMLFMVPIACLMIIFYSVGYSNFNKKPDAHDQPGFPPHKGREPMYSRFFAFLSLFAGAMLTLVVADNLLLLFIGWEIMGLCSYLLIGFWYARTYPDPNKITPRGAAVKAFMTTRVADVFMLLGIAFLYSATGTLSFTEIFTQQTTSQLAAVLFLGFPAAQVIYLLLFIGTIGKSAQFPLHTWLPDAMEGPTPVSAMIHAAAMVSAGVYMIIRMFPLLAGTAPHGELITFTPMIVIGTFTALFAATIAFTQRDVKKVLAYSTISQLGFMVSALGMGAWVAALFHLITHAFFKALLFMGSGSIIHGVEHGLHAAGHGAVAHSAHGPDDHAAAAAHVETEHAEEAHAGHGHDDADPQEPELDPQDMFNMGGLRKKMPVTFWTFLIGGLSLAGFPLFFAGFWSKDEILGHAYHYPQFQLVFWVLVFTAFLTAFYTMRQIALTFWGKPRTEAAEHAHESHWTMLLPLIILAVFAIIAGVVGIKSDVPVAGLIVYGPFAQPGSTFEHLVEPTIANVIELEKLPFVLSPMAIAIAGSLLGLFLGWLVYGRKPLAVGQPDPLEAPLGGLYVLFKNKYFIDEIYNFVFVQPVKRFAAWMGDVFDRKGIDGVLHGIAHGALRLSHAFRSFDTKVVNGGADGLAASIKSAGHWLRDIQTGRVQNYLLLALVSVVLLIALYITLFS
ncbi:NADH-quinone oxidoreductase subunit L [Thermoflexales bacterium]|nr:NADH-quinone oxidoreductase subunit L [Thermoflexales bacterium]